MQQSFLFREMKRDDLAGIEVILDETGLFPSEMLIDMAEPFLSGQAPHQWLIAIDRQRPIGFMYIEPERMTVGTFNLLAIAVSPGIQGSGLGKAMVALLLERLRAQGGRLLLVETSSLDEHAAARAFYERLNFAQEARIRDFYAAGEDKLVYCKFLQGT